MKPVGTVGNYVTRQMAATGKSGREILQELAERNRYKIQLMAMEAGCSHQWMMLLCRKYGYEKPHCKAFKFRGETGLFSEHCRKHGLKPESVAVMFHRHRNKGRAWAIERCIEIRNQRAAS